MWLSNEEFVVQSASVKQPGAEAFLHDFNRLGMGALDRYHQATGGLAGIPAPVLPAPALSSIKLAEPTPASVTLKNSQQFNLIDDPQRIASVMSGRQGIESIAVALSSDPARFRSLLELT